MKNKTSAYATHVLERTSPKGPGRPFIGRCTRCGMQGLLPAACLEPCENTKRMSDDAALLKAIEG